ncbi:MAG: hypothetical protein ACRDKL_10650, partial [Solirubrobacteraceae bacterium]
MLLVMASQKRLSSETGVVSATPVTRPIAPEQFRDLTNAIEQQVSAVVVGQRPAVRGALICLLAG